MNTFNFITADETYRSLYYQLPKVLFTNEQYFSMSNDSKIAYAMLQDRCEYSLKNNWVDEQNHVYFKFTTEELMDLLHCSNKTVAKIKKELKNFNLLFEKRTPPKKLSDGTFIYTPPILYLGKLDVSATDVFKVSHNSVPTESVENSLSRKTIDINVSTENVESSLSDKTALNQSFSESVESTRNLLDIKELDTKDTVDTTQVREQALLDIFVEQADNSATAGISRACLETIKVFSNTVADAQKTVGTLFRAKKAIEKQSGFPIVLEEFDDEIHQTLRNVYLKLATDETIKNPEGFMYRSLENMFKNCVEALKASTSTANYPKVTLHNWD